MPRRIIVLLALLLLVWPAAAAAGPFARATPSTTAAGSARYTIDVSAALSGGTKLTTRSRGAFAFAQRRAHVYKIVPGKPVPEEEIIDGRWTYANSNVTAALGDPNAKPWTRVDTTKLAPARRAGELEAARVLAYLPSGVATARLLDTQGGLSHYRGVVTSTRVLQHVPRSQRTELATILRAEYAQRPFGADFWLDAKNRLRRVRVSYATQGMRFTVVGTYAGFGTRVDAKPPPARDTLTLRP